MSRFWKGFAVSMILLAAVLVGIALWLRAAYPPERIRQMLSDKVGRQLHRQLEVADAKFSLLRGLELRGVRISERPTFFDGTFIEIERIRVLPRLWPLLSKQLIVRSVDFDHPVIRLRRGTDGIFNFSDLKNSDPTVKTVPSKTNALPIFFISRALVTEGEVIFQDQETRRDVSLRNLDLRLSGFSLTNLFGLQAKGVLRIVHPKHSWEGSLATDAHLSFGEWAPALTFEKLELHLGASALNMTGDLKLSPSPRVSAQIELSPFSLSDATPLLQVPAVLADARLSAKWRLFASSTVFHVEGNSEIKTQGFSFASDVSGNTEITSGGLCHTYTLNPKAIHLKKGTLPGKITASGLVEGTWNVRSSSDGWKLEGRLNTTDTALAYGGWLEKPAGASATLSGSVEKRASAPPMFSCRLQAPTMEMTSAGPWPDSLQLSGAIGMDVRARGVPLDTRWEITLDARPLNASYREWIRKPSTAPFRLTATGRLRNGKEWDLPSARAETSAGVLEMAGAFKAGEDDGSFQVHLKGDALDLAQLDALCPSLWPYRLQGHATVESVWTGSVDHPTGETRVTLRNASVLPRAGVALSKLNGHVVIDTKGVDIKTLRGEALDAPFQLSAQVMGWERPTLRMEGDWARLELEKILPILGTSPSSTSPTPSTKPPPSPSPVSLARTTGVLRIGEIIHPRYVGRDFQFRWEATEVGPNFSLLRGTVTVTAATGEIRNLPVAKKINRLLDRDEAVLSYKKLIGNFLIAQGLAEVQPFTLHSDQTDFRSEGQIRLENFNATLRLQLKLPPGSVGGSVGHWMTAEDGRPTIDAKLSGPLADPEVKVIYGDTVRRAVQDIFKKTLGGWKGKPEPTPE